MWSGVPTETASMFFASLSSNSRKSGIAWPWGTPGRPARLVVDVAEGHDVRAVPGVGGDVASTHPAGADARDVHPLARRE